MNDLLLCICSVKESIELMESLFKDGPDVLIAEN